MKFLPKILMAVSAVMFILSLGLLLTSDSKLLCMIFFIIHSLLLLAGAYMTVTVKDPDMDSQRLSNLLQQSEAKYEEYKKETDSSIRKKEEIIQAMSKELEEFKKGIR